MINANTFYYFILPLRVLSYSARFCHTRLPKVIMSIEAQGAPLVMLASYVALFFDMLSYVLSFLHITLSCFYMQTINIIHSFNTNSIVLLCTFSNLYSFLYDCLYVKCVGLVVKTLAWRSRGTGFNSQPEHLILLSKKYNHLCLGQLSLPSS